MIPGIRHRLFVVLLGNNDHGKTTLVRTLVAQATRRSYAQLRKGAHTLHTPRAQEVDAYVFPRSYQEVEKKKYPVVKDALNKNDAGWWQRDLILMPSHLDDDDCAAMIDEAHSAGFDALLITLLRSRTEIRKLKGYDECLSLGWDARWCVDNIEAHEWQAQVEALARDLWVALSAKVFPHG